MSLKLDEETSETVEVVRFEVTESPESIDS